MATRTWLRQDVQLAPSVTYTDNLSAGIALQTSSTDIEYDLNSLRSQVNRVLNNAMDTKWYDDIATVGGVKRGIKQLGTDLYDIEMKKLLFRAQVLTDITVTAAQNWEVLSVAGSEAPTETAAAGAGTANGAVVAVLAGDVGSHSLAEVAGWNAISPKNMVVVRDATTGDPIMSGSKQVWGLIQAESGVIDGDTFDDTNKQVQISFVIENATADDLIACPVVDIAGKSINYSYVRRINLDAVPEQAFLIGAFVDQSASVDVTLNNAIDNQSGPATQQQSIDWRIDDTYTLQWSDSLGANLLKIVPNVAGNEIQIDIDTLDINNSLDADFLNGATFDSGATPINVGVTAGQIDAAANFTIAATGAGSDLHLVAADLMDFTDGYQAASTYDTPLNLSDSSTEWDNFETEFGEVSLLNAIVQASNKGGHDKRYAVCTTNITANTVVTGAGGTPNIDQQLFDFSALDFMTDVNVFLNGQLLRPGANAAANNDYYPGSAIGGSDANGDLAFEFALRGGGARPDVITMEVFAEGL